QALNYSLDYSAAAFKTSAIVNEALLGQQPHDLSGVVRGESEVFSGLARSGAALPALVVNFEQTMSALAANQGDLEDAIATLPTLLRSANGADDALDASFAATDRFARTLVPGIKQLKPTISATLPWFAQLTALASKGELGGLLQYLSPAVDNTSSALSATSSLISEANQLSECFTHVLVPTGDEKITVDSSPPNGLSIYQQLFQSAVGLDSASQNFDGNGHYLRATVGGGSDAFKSQSGLMYGNAVLPFEGTLPAFPSSGAAPAVDGNVPCYKQTAPNLNSAAKGNGP
ncbi:MAG TPA: hypothetical protein VME01_07090, partial [Solirubrobacteraceae bacterium]|nr:hypothetical protein [Solirubrobacteraceae bacterium]